MAERKTSKSVFLLPENAKHRIMNYRTNKLQKGIWLNNKSSLTVKLITEENNENLFVEYIELKTG